MGEVDRGKKKVRLPPNCLHDQGAQKRPLRRRETNAKTFEFLNGSLCNSFVELKAKKLIKSFCYCEQ